MFRLFLFPVLLFVAGQAAAQTGHSFGAGCAETLEAACALRNNTRTDPRQSFVWEIPVGQSTAYGCQYKWEGQVVSGVAQTSCALGPCADKIGQSTMLNRTIGWSRTSEPDANDIAVPLASQAGFFTSTLCDGVCQVSQGAPQSAWRSQVPASNGLHRVSIDQAASYTGQSCTPEEAQQAAGAANEPPPPCPGAQGTVNGKPVCVPSAPTGSNVSPVPEGTGNPTAGPVPSSGPGSGTGAGRTPVAGSGTSAGGPSGAAVRGGGSEGNGQTPTSGERPSSTATTGGAGTTVNVDVRTCGRPGEPPCKIDETGTPTDSPGLDAAKQQADEAAIARQAQLAGGAGSGIERQSIGTSAWSWGLEAGGCSALVLQLPEGRSWSIDPCNNAMVLAARQMLSFFVTVLVGLLLWRSTMGTIGGGK